MDSPTGWPFEPSDQGEFLPHVISAKLQASEDGAGVPGDALFPAYPRVRASTETETQPVLDAMIASDIHLGENQDVPRFEYDPVDGGTLVYLVRRERRDHVDEPVETERRLYGFADVSDWDAVRSALARRGHDVGAIHHLPQLQGGR